MTKNKRGDIPIMILVLGVFVICILAIMSFVFSAAKSEDSVLGYIAVEMANSLREQYHFYENVGYGTAEIEDVLGVSKDGDGYYNVTLTISGEKIAVRFIP